MSLSFAGLERMEEGQRGIEGFFGTNTASAPRPTAVSTPTVSPPKPIPTKRSRSPSTPETHSGTTIGQNPSPVKRRLPTLHTGKGKRPLEGFFTKNGESSKAPQVNRTGPSAGDPAESAEVIVLEDDDAEAVGTISGEGSGAGEMLRRAEDEGWNCPRCGKLIRVPDGAEKTALAEAKQEHEDYHFALDLQNGSSPQQTAKVRPPAKPGASAKKKKEGIKAFFAPKAAVKKEE